MMKMNHRQTDNPLVYFVIPLVVLVHHLLQKQCLPLHLCICVRDEEVGVFIGKLQGRGWQIGLNRHVVFLEEVVGYVVVGVTFEVRFIGLIRLQIYLVVLEDP